MNDGVATAVWFLAIEPARAHRILDRHRADDDGRCPICRHRSNPCPDCQLSGWALRALDVAESRLVWDPDRRSAAGGPLRPRHRGVHPLAFGSGAAGWHMLG